jgi:hypothetical protein
MSATVLTGQQIPAFQFVVITGAMRMYIVHGIKASRNYTPANMLAFASTVTGKQYKRNGLRQAYEDIRAMYPDANIRPL